MEDIVQQARREVGKVLREAGYEKEFKIEMKACISLSKKTKASQAFGDLTRHHPWIERSLQSPIGLPGGVYLGAYFHRKKCRLLSEREPIRNLRKIRKWDAIIILRIFESHQNKIQVWYAMREKKRRQ